MCNVLHNDGVKIKENGIGYKLFRKDEQGNLINLIKVQRSTMVLIQYALKEGDSLEWNDEICWTDKLMMVPYYTRKRINGKLFVDEDYVEKSNAGFCFFLDKQTAIEIKEKWEKAIIHDIYICKIKYEKGIGKHIETNMLNDTPVNMALCKKFTVMEEI
jgi:hypothetical protein